MNIARYQLPEAYPLNHWQLYNLHNGKRKEKIF
jgi:hypothetical protein